MDIAIVTGASSSLGLAISRRLIQLGFRVYGLGGDYTDCPLQNVNFRPVSCNLADPAAVEAAGKRILEKEKKIFVLVNNAKYFGAKSYLEMSPEEMQRVLNINLLSPLVLARTFAEGLMSLQGYIIQLGPLHVESSRGGPTGAATAGGLKWMSELLFQDLREFGVRVCHLSPEPNRGRDPRTTPRQGTRVTSAIDPEAVAQALEQLLQTPFGNIVTEMVIRPLRVSEPEQDPVVKLPYPKPKPVPYTIPREIIEAEEQLEEEEFRKKDKRRRSRPQEGKKKEAEKEDTEKPVQQDSKSSEEKGTRKRKRPEQRPTSRKKAETSPRPDAARKPEQQQRPDPKPAPDSGKGPEAEDKPVTGDKPAQETAPETSRRRRPRRKPRPPKVEVGFHVQPKPEQEAQKPESAGQQEQKPEKKETLPEKKPAKRKRTARKKAVTSEPGTVVKEASEKEEPSSAPKKSARKAAARKKVPRKSAAKKDTPEKAAPAKKAARKVSRKTAKKTVANKKEEAGKPETAAKKASSKRASSKASTDAKSD